MMEDGLVESEDTCQILSTGSYFHHNHHHCTTLIRAHQTIYYLYTDMFSIQFHLCNNLVLRLYNVMMHHRFYECIVVFICVDICVMCSVVHVYVLVF